MRPRAALIDRNEMGRPGKRERACEARRRSGLHLHLVGLEAWRGQAGRFDALVMDPGRGAPSDLLHLLAGFPERDGDEVPRLVIGEQIEALEPWPIPGGGHLSLGQVKHLAKPLRPCVVSDHALEHPVSFEVVYEQAPPGRLRRWCIVIGRYLRMASSSAGRARRPEAGARAVLQRSAPRLR